MSFNHDKNHSEITKGATIEELKAEIERLKDGDNLCRPLIKELRACLVASEPPTIKVVENTIECLGTLASELTALRAETRWVPIEEDLEIEEGTRLLLWDDRKCDMDIGIVNNIDWGDFTHYRIITPPSKEDGK